MKKIIIVFFILFLFICISFLLEDAYHLKVEIKLENVNPVDLDENYAKNIEKDILNLEGIKDVIIFSSKYGINIYCKFNYFANKDKLINKIQRILISYDFKNVYFNEKYYLKYNCFVVVHSKSDDYYSLKNKADLIFDEILKLKVARDVKILGVQEKVINIYLKDSFLDKFNLDIYDIKKNIQKNNIKRNYIGNEISKSLNINFKNIEDVENILFNFKDLNFSIKLKDIFEIKQEIKSPREYSIFYGDEDALVVAISLKKFVSTLFLKYMLSDFDVDIVTPLKIKKTEIYLGENSNFDDLYKKYLEIQSKNKKNNLYFLGLEAPKINNAEDFDEIKNNRIIIFSNSLKFKNNKTNFAPSKIFGVEYLIDKNKLNRYSLSKEDVLNLILLNSNGLFCDYFYDKDEKIGIYLKNDSNFIYSKKLKTFVLKDEIIKTEFKNNYNLIARKNLKKIEIIKNRKPFYN